MREHRRWSAAAALATVLIAAAGCTGNGGAVILATTTSTQDSGLLDVLVPLFEEETGHEVQTDHRGGQR